MIRTLIFDLGNTLIKYYQKDEFSAILTDSIIYCKNYLASTGLKLHEEKIWDRVKKQNFESPDYKVRPLEERLSIIFKIKDLNLIEKLCKIFMNPIFSKGKKYDDVDSVFKLIREKDMKIAIISNTPWGSPSYLWREELERYKLTSLIDEVVFCRDVGWRKPDPRIFLYTLSKLKINASECLFVGDDPRWDIIGPNQVGIKSILIDRIGKNPDAIHSLNQIFNFL